MIGRRRFISIVAGAGLGLALGPTAAAGRAYRWKGTALGAAAQIVLPQVNALELVTLALKEISRLETIFSLYRQDSALSRLNDAGRLSDPPPELLELLGLCDSVHRMTSGAFDPTIQPLWSLYAESYAANSEPTQAQIDKAKQSAGWHLVYFTPEEVGFHTTGCALSLNGIAQGYIADQVARLLRNEGLSDVLVDMGEIVALGRQPDGKPWRIAVQNGEEQTILQRRTELSSWAVATSNPLGTTFDNAGSVGHILDPRTGRPIPASHSVTLAGPKASICDGLSTGLCIVPETENHSVPEGYEVEIVEISQP